MRSKLETRKPNIYIATGATGVSSLDIAEQVDRSPFVGTIFTLEGLYNKETIRKLPEPRLKELGETQMIELGLADIIIIDNRNGELQEASYAVHKGMKIIVFNPTNKPIPTIIHSSLYTEISNLEGLADFNYLKYFQQ